MKKKEIIEMERCVFAVEKILYVWRKKRGKKNEG
jgi:hypothetical protein